MSRKAAGPLPPPSTCPWHRSVVGRPRRARAEDTGLGRRWVHFIRRRHVRGIVVLLVVLAGQELRTQV